jgi:putative ABC transport system substrate-binding protein
MLGITRRESITLLGGAAAAWPLAGWAQQPAVPVIGFLHSGIPAPYAPMVLGFRQGLDKAGYVEGQNMAIAYRWANNQQEQLPALAVDLVRRRVAVIFTASNTNAARAAKAATATVPIVIALGADPVYNGLVPSLNQPGGNVTGVTFLTAELASKRLELLRELVPQATTVAFLSDPQGPTNEGATLQAARALGQQVIALKARSDGNFEEAFATLVERQARALIVDSSPLFTSNRDKLLALAALHKIPTMYHAREFPEDGGLISYGANLVDSFRQGGFYVGRILKGDKPADLPVLRPTKFELVINRKTATALGLAVPPSILVRATEVIE